MGRVVRRERLEKEKAEKERKKGVKEWRKLGRTLKKGNDTESNAVK